MHEPLRLSVCIRAPREAIADVLARHELERMAMSIEVSQDAAPQLYASAIDLHIPFLFQVWMYLMQGEDSVTALLDFVLDVYALDSFELQRSVAEIGNVPWYIQVWNAPGEGA